MSTPRLSHLPIPPSSPAVASPSRPQRPTLLKRRSLRPLQSSDLPPVSPLALPPPVVPLLGGVEKAEGRGEFATHEEARWEKTVLVAVPRLPCHPVFAAIESGDGSDSITPRRLAAVLRLPLPAFPLTSSDPLGPVLLAPCLSPSSPHALSSPPLPPFPPLPLADSLNHRLRLFNLEPEQRDEHAELEESMHVLGRV
ncbi:hypothetical protein JCM10213_007558 [Rhodosporidiobolus nylandii]